VKAITIYPEWCFAICRLGKNVENRVWAPQRRGLEPGERFAIHAGKYVGGRPSEDARRKALRGLKYMAARAGWIVDAYRTFSGDGIDMEFRRDIGALLRLNDLPRSAVVAVATLGGVCRDSSSPWAVEGQYHLRLDDVIVLPEPVSCGGRQMLWTLPAGVEIEVQRQINAATIGGEEAF
jgi:hypothetical protein